MKDMADNRMSEHLSLVAAAPAPAPTSATVDDLIHANALVLQAIGAAFAGWGVSRLMAEALGELAQRAEVAPGVGAVLVEYRAALQASVAAESARIVASDTWHEGASPSAINDAARGA